MTAPNTTTPTTLAQIIERLESAGYLMRDELLRDLRALAAAPSSPPPMSGAERENAMRRAKTAFEVIAARLRESGSDNVTLRRVAASGLEALRSVLSAPAAVMPAGSEERDREWLSALKAEYAKWGEFGQGEFGRTALDNVAARMGLSDQFAALLRGEAARLTEE